MSLFKLRGTLSKSQSLILGLIGFILLIAVWWLVAELKSENQPIIENFNSRLESTLGMDSTRAAIYADSIATADSIALSQATEFQKVYPVLPRPDHVLASFSDLYQKDKLATNTWRSIWLNLQGYFWAVLISIILGFFIGLIPFLRGLFSKQVEAMRYLPLTALIGLFIIWFGIGDGMKIAFLAFGIIVYLLPVVIQRIDEVEDVYLKTVFTLGATDWQTIKTVYIPSVMSKLIDDIRVLTAISWTYIIIVEYINKDGGIGALIWIKQRQGQKASMFAILIIIILIGFFQDRIFQYIDKRVFPHKYYKTTLTGIKETQYGIYAILGIMIIALFVSSSFFTSNILPVFLITGLIGILYGEFRIFQNRKIVG